MRLLALLLAALVFSGCTSPQARQEAGGIATVSALAVALPLIPVAEAYHAVFGDAGQSTREALRARLDPVYEARIALIGARDPLADAKTLQQAGVIALLPSLPDGTVYPGLQKPGTDFSAFPHNADVVNHSELAAYLQKLMANDPSDNPETNGGIVYMGPVQNRFREATWRYKTAFNLAMYRTATAR